MGLLRVQPFRLDFGGNKVGVLYAPTDMVRDCRLENWNTYFRRSIKMLFMLPILSFFLEFLVSLDVDVSVFNISTFFPVDTSAISAK
jgi:hypothetical protein